MIAEINQQRATAGVGQLWTSASLNSQSQSWAQQMAARDVLSHSGSGYGGEIIASGAETASEAVSLWLQSGPHREIMLSGRYTSIGAGQMDGYWVVQFR